MLMAYAESMSAVRAEESLSRVMDGRAALPTKPAAANSHVRSLQREAMRHTPRRPANLARLQAAGIRVERVKKEG